MIHTFFLALVFGVSTLSQASIVPTHHLKEAYQAALARSETVEIEREHLNQSSETSLQAQREIYPTLTGSWNPLHQQVPTSSNSKSADLSDQVTTKLSLLQPVFRGFREMALIRQKKAFREAQVENIHLAARQLYLDVANSYFTVKQLQSDLNNLNREIEILKKRENELSGFIKMGRSRQTDLLNLRASFSSLQAQAESTKGQLESSLDVLSYFTGWPQDIQLDDEIAVPEVKTLEAGLARVDQRPEVQAALKFSQGYEQEISIAQSGHYPTLDLLGNYYFNRPGYPDGQPDWDISLMLNIPIFQGGIVSSQVRQAQSLTVEQSLIVSRTRKLAEEEIRSLFHLHKSEEKQISQLQETVRWSKKSYDIQTQEYRRGLITNLEVLTTIATYQDAQRQLDHQILQSQLTNARLNAATASLPELDSDAKPNER